MTPLLTTPEVARRLGVSTARVRQLILSRRLPAQKVGRDWLVHPDDLHWVASRPTGRPRKLEAWPDDAAGS